MKVLRNILIALGAVFVGIIALVAYLGVGAHEFRRQEASFIGGFMRDFSRTWDAASVRSKLSDDLLKQFASVKGSNALEALQTLGRFRSMSGLSLESFSSATWGKSGTFRFKGHFANGPADVEIIVERHDGKTLVSGLHITPSRAGSNSNIRREI